MGKKVIFVVGVVFILFGYSTVLAYSESELRQEGANYRIPDGVPAEQFQRAEAAQVENINRAEQLNNDMENRNFIVSYNTTSINIPTPPPPINGGGNQHPPIMNLPQPPTDIIVDAPDPPVLRPSGPEIEEGSPEDYMERMRRMYEQIRDMMRRWWEQRNR